MKQTGSLFLVFCAALAVSNLVQGGPDEKGGDPTAGANYIGEKACKKCHFKEHKTWKAIAAAIKADGLVTFVPKTRGNHGSRALWSKFKDAPAYWKAVEGFLAAQKK